MTAQIPEWLVGLLLGSGGGGAIGYLFCGWIDDRFARTKEARALKHSDENAMKFPKDRRLLMYLIANLAYQLARGARHFLERHEAVTK